MVQTIIKLSRKVLIPFILSCLFLATITIIGIVFVALDNYKQELILNDIKKTRNLLHEATDYSITYTEKTLSIEEMYDQALIRSPEGQEVIKLFEDNIDINITKALKLTEDAKNSDPRTWKKLTELIDKRLQEKQLLQEIEKEYVAKMSLYEKQAIPFEEWDNYAQVIYVDLIKEWNALNRSNTDFHIENRIEWDPASEELDRTETLKYKPTIRNLFKNFWNEDSLVEEGYEDTEPYPIITYIKDDKGNETKLSEYNKYYGYEVYKNNVFSTPLKAGDYIFIRVGTQDLVERKMLYKFSSNSETFNNYYMNKRPENQGFTEKNYLLYKISESDKSIKNKELRIEVNIKTENDKHRDQNNQVDDKAIIKYNIQK